MSNFKARILEAVGDEKIIAIKILGNIGYWKSSEDPRNRHPLTFDTIYTWEEVAPFLDYIFNEGYGSMDCHDIVFWTDINVYYIHEYDGSTDIHCQLRNPG